MILRCERVVLADGPDRDVELVIDDGRIVDVRDATGSAGQVLDGWVVPGFVDTHVHGGGGADYASGDPDEILAARDFHRRHGTTTSYASLVTAELGRLEQQIAALVPLVRDGELAGIHLEGPFLSAAKCGAHDPALLRDPDPVSLQRLLDAAQGTLAMITVAPELPGAEQAIERLSRLGIGVALGHTDADSPVAARGLADGARTVTHLFNAMRPIHHRDPGPIPLLLSDDRVLVELICDGHHLAPDVIALAVRAAGVDRVALITDAMTAAGQPDGDYRIGELAVRVVDGQARLAKPDGSLGSIAGSTLTMAAAVAFLVRHGWPIPEIARMAATSPAAHHGLDDVGELSPGRRADLCVLDDAGRLQRVMAGGRWVS